MVLRFIHPAADDTSLEERFEAQTWLYRLTDAVSRATDLDDIFDHALDCLQQVLRIEQAAILLYDERQVMRFRAWRKLSDGYRQAVDGHSPWRPDEPDPQPVLIEDVAADATLEPLRPVISREGIAAMAFVPLINGGRLLGKFMVYYPAPHRFAPLEIACARAVASHVALAVGRLGDAAELRHTRDQLEIVLQSIADGVSVQTPDGQLLFGNRAALDLLGLDSVEQLQTSSAADLADRFDILDDRGRPFPLDELPGRLALAGRPGPERLIRYRRRGDGSERWSYVRATPVFDQAGQVRFAVNVFQDVTAQRRSEEAARFVAEVTGLLAGSLEPEETCARLAQALVPRLGAACAVHSVDDTGTPRRTAVAGETEPEVEPELVLRAITEGTVLVASEPSLYVPLRGRDRILGAVYLRGAPAAGGYDAQDVALAEKVARRGAVALEAALLYRQATEAVRVRDDFLSVAGHELRTPLTTAQILVQSLARTEPLSPALALRVGKLERTVSRLTDLVDDLLDVSRIRAGRPILEPALTDLGALAEEVAGRCRDAGTRAGCELRVQIASHPTGRWDPARLTQVIENLIGNAIKYAPGEPIDLRVADREGDAVLTVRDHGPGISAEDRERVFGRFERASSSRHYGGLGLGLWITRQIVEAHGGSVGFVDPDGPGCCVEIVLPR